MAAAATLYEYGNAGFPEHYLITTATAGDGVWREVPDRNDKTWELYFAALRPTQAPFTVAEFSFHFHEPQKKSDDYIPGAVMKDSKQLGDKPAAALIKWVMENKPKPNKWA